MGRKTNKPLDVAIDAAGGIAALGRALGITTSAVAQWRTVPPKRVLKVEEITGVSRHDLRPDIYGRRGRAA